jgi:WD40 repeat protein
MKLPCAAALLLFNLFNCIVIHAQTEQGAEQPIVRLKATLDVSGFMTYFPEPLNLMTFVRSRTSSFNSTHDLMFLHSKKTWHLLDLNNGKIQTTLTGLKGIPILSPNAQRLLIIEGKKAPQVLHTRTGEKICEIIGHEGEVSDALWSPDEKSIVLLRQYSGFRTFLDKEKTVARLYDAASCKLQFSLKLKTVFAQVAFSPDSRTILTTNDKEDPRLWDAQTGQLKATLRLSGPSIYTGGYGTFSPDGSFVVVSNRHDGITLWDASTGKLRLPLAHSEVGKDSYQVKGISPDGSLLMLYREHFKRFIDIESTIELRDTVNGEIRAVFGGANMQYCADQVAWSSDGMNVVTAGGNKEFNGKIWDISSEKLIATFPMVAKESRMPFSIGYKDLDHISFHPSRPIITVANNKYLRLLNAKGELLQKLDNATHPAKWTSDGRLLITVTKDLKTLQIWELL